MLAPVAILYLAWMKRFLTSRAGVGLIEGCRVAYSLWEGVAVKKWSFLSPPWLLRDDGKPKINNLLAAKSANNLPRH